MPILFARFNGLVHFIEMLRGGNPTAYLILAGSLIVAFAIIWLAFELMLQRGQKFADDIGNCTFEFAPDGFFGMRFFRIVGRRDQTRFFLDSRKTQRKGDHRTFLEIEKPRQLSWSEIGPLLPQHQKLIKTAMKINEHDTSVTFVFVGFGGDGKVVNSFVSDFSKAVLSISADATGE